ncbi:hypothetical protein CFIO01_13126 [Colletotrichum fioriniae PJ7]|uniref:Uncharacterized protein n=1 Tax=Colletotrichum fioriniae PJ7 TaxID=1445577 RepID=A0A010SF13_9PEZI|nr:hypothetical protein CFIO01_13126 [Colletotrichum fioriniae PJ7]
MEGNLEGGESIRRHMSLSAAINCESDLDRDPQPNGGPAMVEEPPLRSLSGQCKAEKAPNDPNAVSGLACACSDWLQSTGGAPCVLRNSSLPHKASSRLVCGQIRSPTGFVPSSIAVFNVWDPGGGGGRSHIHEASRDWFLAGARVRDSENPKTLDDVCRGPLSAHPHPPK